MKHKWLPVVLILLVAAVFRLQHISTIPPVSIDKTMDGIFKAMGPLRVMSATAGILTVLGLYLLASRLFSWQIAAISSFLLAISFWHVHFSRAGDKEIFASLFFTFSVYFLWRGLSSIKLWNFAVSGIFFGLAFYFCRIPYAALIILILTLAAYWRTIQKDFDHEKYLHTRNTIIRGLALLFVIAFIVALPVIFYFYIYPENFWGGAGRFSVFSTDQPLKELAVNAGKTLVMFNFSGDRSWLHNISGQPILLWPIGVLFIIGILKSLIKFFATRKRHGHFSSVQALLLSWFFIGLVPAILSTEGSPNSLTAIFTAPAVFIFAGEGLWWIIDKIGDWHRARDVHEFRLRHRWMKESSVMAIFALVVLLLSFTVAEYDKYFNKWAKNPNVISAFNKIVP